MFRGKKGSVWLGVTIAIVVYIFGILFLPFIADDVDTFRINMNCSNSSITDSSKLACLVGDLTIPYFIWILVSIAIGFIVGGLTP